MCSHPSDSITTWPTSRHLFHHTDFLESVLMFCFALLFTDIVENFEDIFRILMTRRFYWYHLYTYPKPKYHHLKTQMRNKMFLPVSDVWKLLANNFLSFKRRSAQDRLKELKWISIELNSYEDSAYVFKIFLWCLWMKQQCNMSSNTIFWHLGGKLAHRGSGNSNTLGICCKW